MRTYQEIIGVKTQKGFLDGRLNSRSIGPNFDRQAGMSLVGVMVGVAIMGIVAYVLAEVFKNQFRAQKDLDLKVARMAVVRNLNARIDDYCSGIVVPANCPDPTYLEIPGRSGQPVIISKFNPGAPTDAQRMGDLYVRAKCKQSGSGKELKVEAVDAKRLQNAPALAIWADVSPQIPLACNINR